MLVKAVNKRQPEGNLRRTIPVCLDSVVSGLPKQDPPNCFVNCRRHGFDFNKQPLEGFASGTLVHASTRGYRGEIPCSVLRRL